MVRQYLNLTKQTKIVWSKEELSVAGFSLEEKIIITSRGNKKKKKSTFRTVSAYTFTVKKMITLPLRQIMANVLSLICDVSNVLQCRPQQRIQINIFLLIVHPRTIKLMRFPLFVLQFGSNQQIQGITCVCTERIFDSPQIV